MTCILAIVFAALLENVVCSPSDFASLGLPVGSAMDAVKAAYRREALKWHPDRNNDPGAHDMFIKITSAYEAIKQGSSGEPPQQNNPFEVFKDFMGGSSGYSFSFSSSGMRMSGTSSSSSTYIQNGKKVTKTVVTDLGSGQTRTTVIEEDLRTGTTRTTYIDKFPEL